MHKCKLTNQERIAAVKEYLDGHGSYATIARKYGIVRTTLREAVNLYLSQGEHALYTTSKNTHYSPELKRQAVEAYLSGEGSQQDICNRFHIRSKSQLRDWIRLYNGHNEFRSYTGHRSDIYMPLRYNNDKQKKPLFSRGLSVCRLLFNSFSKLKIDENYKEKRRLFY